MIKLRSLAAAGVVVATLTLGTAGVATAGASPDPLINKTIDAPAGVSPDFTSGADTGKVQPKTAEAFLCHGHVDKPKAQGGSVTYPGEIFSHGYAQCTKVVDVSMKINLQYYSGGKWVTITYPYGYNHELTSYLTVGFEFDCDGGAFHHFRTIGQGNVQGTFSQPVASAEITANCGI
jgi:hypothetical protein